MSVPASKNNPADMMAGLHNISSFYDSFIIDIFGVIHDGLKPFPGTIDALTRLKEHGKQMCLLSNTPRRAKGAIDQMTEMGIPSELYDHVVTSGEATFHALKKRPDEFHKACGHQCWFIGTPTMEEIFEELDLEVLDSPHEASFILNSIPGTHAAEVEILKDNLKTASEKDLPMICANPDLVVNIGDQQHECAGTFAKYYEELGGRVVYHGKPHAPVYERCHELLGKPEKSKIVALGDSFHTDIAGANNFGIDSVFNLVGIHWEEVQLDHAPGEADLEKIKHMVDTQPHKPTYTIAGFHW